MTEQNWTFECPFTPVIEAACRVAGQSLECDIDFGDIPDPEALGATNFPDDKGRVQVRLRPDMAIGDSLSVLAHELAHVIVGKDGGHGPEWEKTYADIHEEYTRWYDERLKKEQEKADV